MARPKSKRPRTHQVPVRVSDAERDYLSEGMGREPTGPAGISPWLRGLGMARTQELTGLSISDWEARRKGKPR